MDFEKQFTEAMRAKLLREIEKDAAHNQSIINNYGGGGGAPVSVREHMAAGAVAPQGDADEDYYVAIKRQSDKNNPKDWNKLVRRFKTKKDEKPPRIEDLFG